MANLALVFDLIGRDISGSKTFKDVGNAAEKAGKQGEASGALLAKGLKLAGGALLGGGLIEGFKALYEKAQEAATVGRVTNAVLKSTGDASHESAKGVADLAQAISNKSGIDHVAIESGENLLLTFTNIRNETGKGNDIFNQATQAVTDMSVALGQDMKSSAIQLGKALNDPIKGLTALQRVGVQFTESQKEQIKTLVESGHTLDAQKIILAELTKEFGGAAEAASTPLQKLKTHIGDLAEEAGAYLIPAVDTVAKFLDDHLLPAASKVASMVGGTLNPALHLAGGVLGLLADIVGGAVGALEKLPKPLQEGVLALVALVALRGPVSGMFSTLSGLLDTVRLRAMYAKDAVSGFGGAMGTAKAGAAGLASAIGPLGAATVVVSAQQALMSAQTDKWAKALEHGGQAAAGARDEMERTHKFGQTFGTGILGLIGHLTGLTSATDFAKSAGDGLTGATKDATDATKAAGDAALVAAPKLEYLGKTVGMSSDDIDAANKTWETWIGTLQNSTDAFVDPLKSYQDMAQKMAQATADSTKSSKDSWSDYIKNVKIDLSDYASQLEQQLKDQDNWRDNLVKIAQRGGVEVAQQFAAMGEQGAGLTAQMASATDANFSRMAADMAAKAAAGGQDAAKNLDEGLRIMAEVGKEGGAATAAAVAQALGVGASEVLQIAQQYGVNLAAGINPLLSALGKSTIDAWGTFRPTGFIGPVQTTFIGPHRADGGILSGSGTGTSDSILFAGSDGEFIVNAYATARHRALLEAINSAPRFAGGGFLSASDVPHPYSTAPFRFPMSTPADATMSTEYDDVTAYLRSVTSSSGVGATGLGGSLAKLGVQALVQVMAAQRGWGSGAEWTALAAVINRESGWNPNAANPTSSARGLFQKLTSVNGPLESTLQGQANWGLNYIGGRYGDPIRAWQHEMQFGWYDDGGWLKPGYTLAYNGTGKPERVTSGGGPPTVIQNFTGPITTQDIDEFARQNAQRVRRAMASYAVRRL